MLTTMTGYVKDNKIFTEENISSFEGMQFIITFLDENIDITNTKSTEDDKIQAFHRFEEISREIRKNLPEDFDAEKELEESRKERYGITD